MKNNSLTFPDYPENDTILPDFPVCINPELKLWSKVFIAVVILSREVYIVSEI